MKMIDHNHFICHLILGTFTEYPFLFYLPDASTSGNRYGFLSNHPCPPLSAKNPTFQYFLYKN